MNGPVARAWLIVPMAASEESAIKRLLLMSAPWEFMEVWTWMDFELFKKLGASGIFFPLFHRKAPGKVFFYLLAAAAGPWAPYALMPLTATEPASPRKDLGRVTRVWFPGSRMRVAHWLP